MRSFMVRELHEAPPMHLKVLNANIGGLAKLVKTTKPEIYVKRERIYLGFRVLPGGTQLLPA